MPLNIIELLKNEEHRKTLIIKALTVFILLGALIISPASVKSINHILYKAQFIGIGVIIFYIIWLLSGYKQQKITLLKTPTNILIPLFIAWSALTLTWATNPNYGLDTFMIWLTCALFYFIVANSLKDEETLPNLLIGIYISGFIVALIGIQQHHYPAWAQHILDIIPNTWGTIKNTTGQILSTKIIEQVVPPASTFSNRNMAVHYIILTLPLGISFLLTNKKKSYDWFFAITIALMITYLLYTQTRSGWLVVTIQLILFAILMIWKKATTKITANKILAITTSIIALLYLSNINQQTLNFEWGVNNYFSRAQTIVEQATVTSTNANARIGMWQDTLKMIKANPLQGVGVGNYEIHSPLYQSIKVEQALPPGTIFYHPHNDILEIIAEIGIIGFIFLLIILMYAAYQLTRVIPQLQNKTQNLLYAIAIALIGIGLNAQFSFPLQRLMPPLIIMTYLGIIAALYHDKIKTSENPETKIHIKGRYWWALSAIAMLALISVTKLHNTRIASNANFGTSMKIGTSGNVKQMLKLTDKAAQQNDIVYVLAAHIWLEYGAIGKPQKAIENYLKAIKGYPHFRFLWLNLGESYLRNKQPHKAIMTYQHAANMPTQYQKWMAHYGLARTYESLKKYTKAKKQYHLALQNIPKENTKYQRNIYNLLITLTLMNPQTKMANKIEHKMTTGSR